MGRLQINAVWPILDAARACEQTATNLTAQDRHPDSLGLPEGLNCEFSSTRLEPS